ncbi:hypothetical protein P3W45_000386 [Vairimorpha bombi]|jgi:DNA repair protein RAD50
MTILKKLEIKGIRSYNPRKAQTIDFQLPLTLIVGQNGTGKTTIIECLKYITTGIMPPNSRGGAFIYDGGLAKNTDVKAEIKLFMEDLHNREIVLHKILQSSVKLKRVEQKTLEFNVLVNNISKEIIDFDNTVKSNNGKMNQNDLTSIFNINSSILENIIFCHQDDAMWYLGDPATIKKKFDDIFSSTRYSKILDNLKKAKKEISSKIKVIQTELSYLLKLKEKKYDVEKKLLETCDDLENKVGFIKGLESKMGECAAILKELSIEYNKILIIDNKRKEIANFKNLKEVKWTEDECNKILDTLDIKAKEVEISKLNIQINKECEEIRAINEDRSKFEKIQKQIESLKNKKENLEAHLLDINIEASGLEKWLIDQQKKFQTKLSVDDPIMKTKEFKKIFDIFFTKYNSECSKKNQIILDIKKEYDKLYWEISNNEIKIKELIDVNIDQYSEEDFVVVDNLDSRIALLEKEYENSMNLNKDSILNEEKKKRREELIKKVGTKTKSSESMNLKYNNEKIAKLKSECKSLNESSNKLNIYMNMITNKKQNFNAKIYSLGFDEKNTDLLFLGHDICNKLINLSIKNKQCFLCEKDIDNKDRYHSKIKNLGNKRIEENLRIHENNSKICKEINDIVKIINVISKDIKVISDFDKTEEIANFPKYVNSTLQIISEIKAKLLDDINTKEMEIIDLEEENSEIIGSLKLFEEIENITIKDVNSIDISEIQKKLKKYKLFREIKEKKEKIELRNQLTSTNKISSQRLAKVELDLKHKTEKYEVLKNSIMNKRSEIDVKIIEYFSKRDKIEMLKSDIEKISIELDKLTKNNIINSFDDYNKIIENNLHAKNKLNNLKNELMESKQTLNSVNEHLEYYKNINKFKKIESEIKLVESNLIEKNCINKSSGSDNIIKDYLLVLSSKIENIKTKEKDILEKKNILKGEINQLENQKRNYEIDLKTEYKDVIVDYNKRYLESKILEMSSTDIDKCSSVLDKSIIDYHYNKIEEINLTLKELWSNCYKGNDIDCIKLEINENGTKNYSYKMTIVKNGVELDMRNRTSAGQKMIGNILLRMALSKVFCCNFNVLTLDEPTTNLDKENIESLAYTLIGITKTNPNLQLIIITHDENFVDIMCRENLEFFYRLTRNNNGDSVIIKENI